ncbi:MAG: ABC transporter ATP-binding protein [Bacteroidota bacterium]
MIRFLKKITSIFNEKEKVKFFWLALAILLMGLLEVVGVASILPFMQLVAEPATVDTHPWMSKAYQYFDFTSHRQMLIYFGLAILLFIAFTSLFSIFATWLQYKYSWEIAHSTSMRLLNTYIHKPYRFFVDSNSSKLGAYVISEVGNLTGGVLIPTIEIFSRAFVSIIILGLLLWVEIKIALIMFGALGGAYVLIYQVQKNILERIGHHRINMNLLRYQSLQEFLDGIKTVMVYNRQAFFYDRYEYASNEFCNVQPKYNLMLAAPKNLLELIAFGSILGSTIYLFIDAGNIQSAIPRLSLYAVAGYRLLPALQKAFAATAKLKHNLPILDKLHPDLVFSLQHQNSIDNPTNSLRLNQQLKINQLNFTYDRGETPIINHLSIDLLKGKTIAFVGSTGSGKTTLVDLIVGLLEPTEGEIVVDEIAITPSNVKSWRASLAYIPQEVFLFDDTLLCNITFETDKEKIDYDLLKNVTQMADIYQFIEQELPEGFDTKIGEKGVRLSGGQRQRLGLARALYTKPEVLILDEATSALDSITEQGVIRSLKLLPKNITTIIIAHRLSTVRHADQIYILEAGRIVDQGTYEHLMQVNDTFKKMVALS